MKFFCKTVEHPEGEYIDFEIIESPKSDMTNIPGSNEPMVIPEE